MIDLSEETVASVIRPVIL